MKKSTIIICLMFIAVTLNAQKSIYTDIIKELTEATAALDAGKTIETADVLYGGNIALWKKFANSLLLFFLLNNGRKKSITFFKDCKAFWYDKRDGRFNSYDRSRTLYCNDCFRTIT